MSIKPSAMGVDTFPFASYVPTNDPTFRSTQGRFCTSYQRQYCTSPSKSKGSYVSPPSSPAHSLCHEKIFPFKLVEREAVDGGIQIGKVTDRGGSGSVVVICGPSGVGKSTLIKMLLQDFPQRFALSVSHTSRPPRPGEKPGVHYHFVGRDEFLAQKEFIEKNEVYGNLYGTSLSSIDKVREEGKVCVLDIDVQGADCIKQSSLRKHAVFIFVAPPSMKVLEQRLMERNTDTPVTFERRMAEAVKEMEAQLRPNFWDYIVVNDNLQRCYGDLIDILHLSMPHRRTTGEPPENDDTALEKRRGKVLGKNCWLRGKRPSLDNKPKLRQILDGNLIFGIANPESAGIKSSIEEILQRTPIELRNKSNEDIIWIQLRQDPFVYINGRPFSVTREGADGEPIWDRYLKNDVMEESRPYFGQILLHYDDGTQAWEPLYSVETEAEVFQKLTGYSVNIRYVRIPMSTIFTDQQIETLRGHLRTSRTVLFSSTQGTVRPTYAMAVAALLQQKPESGITEMPQITAAQKLANLFTAPLDWVAEICEKVDDISAFRELPPQGNIVNRTDQKERRAMVRYLHISILATYLRDQVSAPEGDAFRHTFIDWVSKHSRKLKEVWDLADA